MFKSLATAPNKLHITITIGMNKVEIDSKNNGLPVKGCQIVHGFVMIRIVNESLFKMVLGFLQ